MRRSRSAVLLVAGAIVLGALVAGVALASGGGRAIDRTSVAPASAAARERANRQAARREAARLLGRLVLPPGATASTGEPAGDHHVLARPGSLPGETKLIDRPSWWRVPGALSDIAAFVRAHVPPGSQLDFEGSGGRPPTASVGFAFPPVGHALGTRMLVVSLVALPGGQTGMRADAEVQWIVPRPARERVPRDARALRVTVGPPGAPRTQVIVVNLRTVRRIAALIDGLPIAQPEIINCPGQALGEPVVTFAFLAAPAGPVLARATEQASAVEPTTPCDPMTLTIRGHHWPALLGGAAVVRDAQRLLRVRLARR